MRFCLIFSFLLLSLNAIGQNFDDSLSANGYAKYSEFGNDVFIAALYVDSRSDDVAALRNKVQKRIEIKIVADKYSYRRLASMFVKGAAINNRPALLTSNAQAMENFLSWFRGNFVQGDHIVLNNQRDGFSFYINGVKLADIKSPQLFNILLNTWIGEVPPSREFKASVLGEKNASDFAGEFLVLESKPSRISEIERWKSDAENTDVLAREQGVKNVKPVKAAAVVKRTTPSPVKKAVQVAAKVSSVVPKSSESKSSTPESNEPKSTSKPKVVASVPAKVVKKESVKVVIEATPKPVQKLAKIEPQQAISNANEYNRNNEFSAENLLATQLYTNTLLRHCQSKMIYPRVSRRLGQTGTIVAMVTIDREGKLISSKLTEATEHKKLNAAVEKGIKRSVPYPNMPDHIKSDTFTFQVPVAYKLAN